MNKRREYQDVYTILFKKTVLKIQCTLSEIEINCHHLFVKNIVSRVFEKPHKKTVP